jgi:hypothetical protein
MGRCEEADGSQFPGRIWDVVTRRICGRYANASGRGCWQLASFTSPCASVPKRESLRAPSRTRRRLAFLRRARRIRRAAKVAVRRRDLSPHRPKIAVGTVQKRERFINALVSQSGFRSRLIANLGVKRVGRPAARSERGRVSRIVRVKQMRAGIPRLDLASKPLRVRYLGKLRRVCVDLYCSVSRPRPCQRGETSLDQRQFGLVQALREAFAGRIGALRQRAGGSASVRRLDLGARAA